MPLSSSFKSGGGGLHPGSAACSLGHLGRSSQLSELQVRHLSLEKMLLHMSIHTHKALSRVTAWQRTVVTYYFIVIVIIFKVSITLQGKAENHQAEIFF